MKYLNFIVDKKGLIPTKHINHKGYEAINEAFLRLVYHDFIDHGNNQDGSMYRELLAQGAYLYNRNYISYIYDIVFVLRNNPNIPKTTYKPSKEFKERASFDRFVELSKDRIELNKEEHFFIEGNVKLEYSEEDWVNLYNIIGKGYDMAKRRKLKLNEEKLKDNVLNIIENLENYKLGQRIRIPIKECQ